MIRTALALAILLATASSSIAATSNACVAEIKQVVYDTLHAGPFEMTSTMTTSQYIYRNVAQVVPDIGLHSRGQVEGDDSRFNEMVMLDGRVWQRYDEKWTEIAAKTGAFERAMSEDLMGDLDHMLQPRCLGLLELDGKSYRAYSFGGAEKDITAQTTIYVDTTTNLTARVDGKMTIAGDVSDTIALYRYDPSITITAPM